MTEKTPVLIADVRSLDLGEATARRVVPVAWMVSVAAHVAAVICFLDRTDRREHQDPPEIVVELVIDLPLREVPQVSGGAIVSLPVALDRHPTTPVSDIDLLVPSEAGSRPAAVPADAAVPVTQTVTLPAVSKFDSAPSVAGAESPPELASAPALPASQGSGILSPVEPLAVPSAAAAPFSDVAAPGQAASSLRAAALPPSPATAVHVDAPGAPLGAAFPEPLTSSRPASPPEPMPPFTASAGEPLRPAAAPPPVLRHPGGRLEIPSESLAAIDTVTAVPPPPAVAAATRPVEPSFVEAAVPASAPAPAVASVQGTLAAQSGSPVHPAPIAAAPPPDALPAARDAPIHPSPVARVEPNPVMTAPFPPPMDAPDPRRALSEAVLKVECGRVHAALDAEAGIVRLSGHVRSAEERELLSKRLADVTGARQVVPADLYIVGEPYCRVLEFLNRPELQRSDDQSQDVAAIAEPAQAGVLTLKGGMPLALQLTGPGYPSYVYVDYFTADGRVYHLLPTASLSDHRLRPNERLTIGGRNGRGVKATIGPPFGLDVVVALASDVPLFARGRPVAEPANAYLADLAAMVAEAHRREPAVQLEYSYYLIQTTEE